jgi:hypothetical protein
MKTTRFLRWSALLAALTLIAAAPPQRTPGPKKPVTITGEILDMGCYVSRGLHDEIHRQCALRCLASGVPMGLLARDSTVYYLTQNHDRAMDPSGYGPPDPYVQCRDWPAKQVAVTGYLWERDGYKELEVRAAKLAPTSPTPP